MMRPPQNAWDKLGSSERKLIQEIRHNLGGRLGHKLLTLTGKDEFMECALDMLREQGWIVTFGSFLPSRDRWDQQIMALMLAIHRDTLPLIKPEDEQGDSTETPPEEISPILMGAPISA